MLVKDIRHYYYYDDDKGKEGGEDARELFKSSAKHDPSKGEMSEYLRKLASGNYSIGI